MSEQRFQINESDFPTFEEEENWEEISATSLYFAKEIAGQDEDCESLETNCEDRSEKQ